MTQSLGNMAPFKVPSNLPELVKTAFHRARASGDVTFYPTQVTILNVHSVPFQLRFSPALANKPKAPLPPSPTIAPANPEQNQQPADKRKPYFDPFDNPPAPMLIPTGKLFPDSHILVLNKFAVVPEHFILATRAFKEQTHLLEEADLRIAYACIEAYNAYHQQQHRSSNPVADSTPDTEEEEEDGGLFVYFNSGPHSGASQPHRHLQLLPVAHMKQGLEPEHKGGKKWGVLADELARDAELREARLPFQTFAEPIHPGTDLRAVYLRLYREACEAVLGAFSPVKEVDAMLGVDTLLDGSLKDGGKDGEETTGVEAKISYNLAMTRHVMVIMPRVAEGETVFCPSSSSAGGIDGYGGVGGTRKPIGKLALNGTVLAGTALVKSQAEWDALRAEPEQLLEILGRIGVPTVQASSPLPREGVPLYGGLDGQGQGRS